MARISFSPLVEEIVGKLAGSVFQDSYGGWQVRTRVTPRNPQSTYQQLRRGEFGFLSASWRGLTSIERQTFIDNAASPGAALNFFLQANVNLTLIEEPTITTYVPSSDPGTMQLEFIEASPSILEVIATGSPLVVPAGTKLLVQVTTDKPQTRIFTNPSMYSPIISFDEGTDLSTAIDILAEWQTRYGQLRADKYMCLKASLIDKSNGRRGADLLNCINTNEMAKFVKIYSDTDQITTSGTAATDAFSFTLPANKLTQEGDCVRINLWGTTTGAAVAHLMKIEVNGVGATNATILAADSFQAIAIISRVDANNAKCILTLISEPGDTDNKADQLATLDFTAAQTVKIVMQCPVSGSIIKEAVTANYELI